jgi:hypothetical protein
MLDDGSERSLHIHCARSAFSPPIIREDPAGQLDMGLTRARAGGPCLSNRSILKDGYDFEAASKSKQT